MNRVRRLGFILLLCCGLPPCARAGLAERVIILANADDRDSVRIARYYAEKRGVPEANIVTLPMPTVETISWRDFVLTIWQPLQDELMRRGWIEGAAFALFDDAGRRKIAPAGHTISYLVLCRGVPLRISHDPALLSGSGGQYDRGEFRTNQGSVDAELSLLAYGPYNINGMVPNPLFRSKEPPQLVEQRIVKVARLDGPQYNDVITLINGGLEAEANGLIGRAYVDARGLTQGPYQQGDQWMKLLADRLKGLHYPVELDNAAGTFSVGARFDQPALYFGWYAGKANGPFVLPSFRFAPGAIAVHIHSYSAATLRSATEGWCGPLVARGAAVTTGAVFEPYLQFMHYPHLLFDAMADGKNVGDAAYYALPCLSWENVLIGDPLYRPFLRGLDEQWARREKLSERQRSYVALREMQRLIDAGQEDAALALGRKEQSARPSLPMGVQLAEVLTEREDMAGARQTLGFAQYLQRTASNDWALLQHAAELLAVSGGRVPAVRTYANLISQAGIPDDLKIDWLKRGERLAIAAGDMKRAIAWGQEANSLAVAAAAKK
ncbi:MAG: TIGR03790 family protein [Opitutaceae bacterium]|nr:TIGR03790 family protein [Opitutaceae bacterium]